jgi:hypothetical protein
MEENILKSDKLTPNKAFSRWLDAASPLARKHLATLAKTSDAMFRQWAVGRRQCSAEKAGEVESATLTIANTVPGAPAALTRADMCPACAKCDYFKSFVSSVDTDDHK